jgi:hypothetical protein
MATYSSLRASKSCSAFRKPLRRDGRGQDWKRTTLLVYGGGVAHARHELRKVLDPRCHGLVGVIKRVSSNMAAFSRLMLFYCSRMSP